MSSVSRAVERSWLEEDGRTEETDDSSGDGSITLSDIEERFHLSFLQKIIIGGGHILNDLCASLWFSYFLLYFQNVAGLSPSYAAVLMLIGQASLLHLEAFFITMRMRPD